MHNVTFLQDLAVVMIVAALVTVAFQWLRNGVAIPGATGSSYLLTAADVDQLVSVRATAYKSELLPISVESTRTMVEPRERTWYDTPKLTSELPVVGETLTVDLAIVYSKFGALGERLADVLHRGAACGARHRQSDRGREPRRGHGAPPLPALPPAPPAPPAPPEPPVPPAPAAMHARACPPPGHRARSRAP